MTDPGEDAGAKLPQRTGAAGAAGGALYAGIDAGSRAKGDWSSAAEFVQASVQLEGAGLVNALSLLGQIHLQLGEQAAQAAQAAVRAQSDSPAQALAQLQAGKLHLAQAHQAFEQAQAAFLRLRQHPQFNLAVQAEVDEALSYCQAMLNSTAAHLH